jgi:transcriptional regulator with XRE-family HTH domain
MQTNHGRVRAVSRAVSPFGQNLALRRIGFGLTVEQLAARSGVSYATIKNCEDGITQYPSSLVGAQLARALGTTVEALLGFTSSPPTPPTKIVTDAELLARIERLADDIRRRANGGAITGPKGTG